MKGRVISLAAGAAMVLSAAGAAVAQDVPVKPLTSAELSEQQGQVTLASGLIALGRAEKDPMMLIVGAKVLAESGLIVVDPVSDDEETVFYDIAGILDEARKLAGDNQELLDAIARVPADPPERGQRYCAWDYECNSIDCGWIYSCGY